MLRPRRNPPRLWIIRYLSHKQNIISWLNNSAVHFMSLCDHIPFISDVFKVFENIYENYIAFINGEF